MLTTNSLEKIQSSGVVPHFLASHKVTTKPYCLPSAQAEKANAFFSTVNNDDLTALNPFAFPVDISEEKALANQESYLEVSVPTQGVVDLFDNSELSKIVKSHASVFALSNQQMQVPHHIVVRDIAGNQYEILLDETGMPELPDEGTGLFSLISDIRYIYDINQIETLFILPPSQTKSAFSFHVSVTKLSDTNHRKVVTIRQIEVEFQDPHIAHDQKIASVTSVGDKYPGLYQVKIGILLLAPFLVNKQLIATVRLETNGESKEGLFLHGWETATNSPLYVKRFGLSREALILLTKHLYPFEDMMKDMLQDDMFSLSTKRGYNNFFLRDDALFPLYERLIDDLIHQRIPGNFLFERVSKDKTDNLTLSSSVEDAHDKIVLSQLEMELKNHRFSSLKRFFLSTDQSEPTLTDFFHVNLPYALKDMGIPEATLVVTQDNHSMNDILESMQPGGSKPMSPLNMFEEEDFVPESKQSPYESSFKLEEIDNAEGFDNTTRSRKNPWTTYRKTRDKAQEESKEDGQNKKPRLR